MFKELKDGHSNKSDGGKGGSEFTVPETLGIHELL